MTTFQRFLSLLLVLAALPLGLSAQSVFSAQLSGRSEVPTAITSASGEVTATLTGDELVVTGAFEGLSSAVDTDIVGGAHLHFGYAGQNGGIAIELAPSLSTGGQSGTFEAEDNTFTLDAEEMAALMERRLYVNIHSINFPGGELRGQVLPEADFTYLISLSGNNEVPSILSNGTGRLALELNGNELTVSGAFSGLEGDFDASIQGGAHLHTGLPGQNGPIAIDLNAATEMDLKSGIFAATDNTFALSEEQAEALRGRALYANIHTTKFPSGELRGQVSSDAAQALFRAHLSGSNENPAVTSFATGVVQVESLGDSLVAYGSFNGLESDFATDIGGGAHIHSGLAGTNGDVSFALVSEIGTQNRSATFPAADNVFSLSELEATQLFGRAFYVNIHSETYPGGEIRGQLLPEAQAIFTAVLSGGFEAPPVATTAEGAVKAELRGNELTVSGSFNGLSSPLAQDIEGGAHLHLAYAGANGGIAYNLASELASDELSGSFLPSANVFELSEDERTALLERRIYVNIHSLENPSGELRGQMLREARYYMAAPLSGTSEVPAVNTAGTGHLMLEVKADSVVATGAFQGLESPFDPNVAGGAHLHDALAGSNGGILQGLAASLENNNSSGFFTAASNTYESTAALREALRARGLYVNIHTEAQQPGEIRGQVLPFATAYFTTSLNAFNEVPIAESEGTGGLKLELRGDELTVSGAFSNLTGAFDESIGAHLHLGVPGENGGVDIPINPTLEGGNMAGSFAAADNVFAELTEEQVLNLLNGNYYANIHTTEYPGGELRGQILPESNFFPEEAPVIQTPVDGTDLLLEGGASTPFVASWSAAMDDDSLAYVWQLSTAADFSQIVLQQNVGGQTFFEADFEDIDLLLENLGVTVGTEVTVYHRAIASDGAVATPGAGAVVNITRGEVVEDLFETRLSGHAEVPPIGTTANGFVSASLDGNELTVSGFFENLSSKLNANILGGAHIHTGYAGENGDVLYSLNLSVPQDSLSGTIDAEENTFTLSEEELALLENRQLYVNIHSLNFPGGELRGQLLPVSDNTYSMSLLGSNEVPSAVSPGLGALVLEEADGQLTISGAFSGMRGDFDASIQGGAHLHIGAAGENGPILIDLNASVDDDLKGGVFRAEDNTFDMTAELEELLQSRTLYANIHTTAFPGGELRGQAVGDAGAVFRAHLSGSNERPVVTTMAGGAVQVEFLNDTTITVSGTYSELESNLNEEIGGGAHIHLGMPGENGDVIIPITPMQSDNRNGRFLPEDNTYNISAEERAALFRRGLYVNIHSLDNPPGAIRGQLMLESQTVFTGFLSGIFEVPAITTSALGGVQAELSGSRMAFVGTFDGLSSPVATDIAGGAHIHEGLAGATGGIVLELGLSLDGDMRGGRFPAGMNTFQLTEGQADTMRARGYYVNIHSQDINSGELRAQLLPEARTYFYAPLSGASEVPAVNSDAGGALAVEVNPGRATASGTFLGLSSMLNTDIEGGAHIHAGYAGQNGPIANLLSADADAAGLNGSFPALANTFEASGGWIDSLRERRYYVNVHSMDQPAGEVRGQLLPLATTYFTNSLSGFNEVQPVDTDANGGVKIELSNGTLVLSGAFSGLGSAFDFDVMNGAHLHLGGPGENGDIELVLNANVADNERSGIFQAANNTFPLTAEQMAILRAGELYLNLHTEEFQTGEIRGQVLPEVNGFPTADANINFPPDGTMLTVQGDASTAFIAEWSAAADRDSLAYVWQLATDEDFSSLLVEQNVDDALAFETTFGVVDQLLENAGIALDESVTLYHRAVATDGSVATAGIAFDVELTRGVVTSTLDLEAAGLSMRAYPTLASSQVTVELNSNDALEGNLMLSNSNGQVLNILPTSLPAGTTTRQMDVQELPAGTYQIQLIIDGQLAGTQRFIKQ